MIGDSHRLTAGYIGRHVPPSSRVGLDIALLDIAQDFLLAYLCDRQVIGSLVVFKGGTALRKLYAGTTGRFSTDVDFATFQPDDDRIEVADVLADECRVTLGPFQFEPTNSRGRWRIHVSSSFGSPTISIKIDVGPPCWLQPVRRPFVPVPIHGRYGFSMPDTESMCLEEILAEKIARLTRMSAARDAFDLVWIASTSPYSAFSNALVRQLAVLKIWVDNHGLRPGWSKALHPQSFNPEKWFTKRTQWDDEQIGLLSHPPPSISQLETDLHNYYRWLRDLTDLEVELAACDPDSRGTVVKAIQQLENSALAETHLW